VHTAVGADKPAAPTEGAVNPDLIFDDLDNAEPGADNQDVLQPDDVLDVFEDPVADQITPPDPGDTPQGV
jgi:hypothetical protein